MGALSPQMRVRRRETRVDGPILHEPGGRARAADRFCGSTPPSDVPLVEARPAIGKRLGSPVWRRPGSGLGMSVTGGKAMNCGQLSVSGPIGGVVGFRMAPKGRAANGKRRSAQPKSVKKRRSPMTLAETYIYLPEHKPGPLAVRLIKALHSRRV